MMDDQARRIAIFGNSASGKTSLALKLSGALGLPCFSYGWMEKALRKKTGHDGAMARLGHLAHLVCDLPQWICEGLDPDLQSAQRRFARADLIILLDLPVWLHYLRGAEREFKWRTQAAETQEPGRYRPPRMEDLFRQIAQIERHVMPTLRDLAGEAAAQGKRVHHLKEAAALDALEADFLARFGPPSADRSAAGVAQAEAALAPLLEAIGEKPLAEL